MGKRKLSAGYICRQCAILLLLVAPPATVFADHEISSTQQCVAAFCKLGSQKPFHFQIKRAPNGTTVVDWAEMKSKLYGEIAALNQGGKTKITLPTRIRIFVDNKVTREVPIDSNNYQFYLRPDEQYSVRLEALTPEGKVIERTEHSLLEKTNIRSVNPANYANEPIHAIHSPLDKKLGIDGEMPEVVQKIGRTKIVYVWKNPDDPKIKALTNEVDFQIVRNKEGKITGYTVTDKARREKGLSPLPISLDKAFVKVDAAFNENAFLWDDSFTCLHVTSFDPELCRQTVEFWLNVQKNHSQGLGDIPREVLKSNGTSYNLYETVHLGQSLPNGSYANPNILGDVVENLVDQTGVTAANKQLMERVLESMKQYGKWMDEHRTVKLDGKVIGYWISDLGSGMDNIGRAPGENFSSVGYVDELARRIELEKSSARIHARLGQWQQMRANEKKAAELDALLNEHYWSKEKGFYFDLIPGPGGKMIRQEDMPTVAGFWPLFSRSASPEQMERIAKDWYTDKTFGGNFPVRSLPPVMQDLRPGSYHPEGGYWRGGNWAPTDIIKALGEERSGRPDLAANTINKKLAADTVISNNNVAKGGHKTVFETIGTDKEGKPIPSIQVEADGRVHHTRTDFVGWGGTPHTFGKLRNSLGIRPVSAFFGKPKDLNEWIKVSESPIFKNSSYFSKNPLRNEAAQKKLFAEGFLEINLPFELKDEPVTITNYEIAGKPVDLKVEKAVTQNGHQALRVSISAKEPIDFNLASSQLSVGKNASSPIVKAKSTKAGTTVVELVF